MFCCYVTQYEAHDSETCFKHVTFSRFDGSYSFTSYVTRIQMIIDDLDISIVLLHYFICVYKENDK